MSLDLQMPFSGFMPEQSREESEALATRIQAEGGIHDPVLVTKSGIVLDGHNRLRLNPDAPRKVINGSAGWSEAQCKAFIYRANIGRRNLSADQRAELQKKAKAVALELRAQQLTQEQIAEQFGVDQTTVARWLGEDISNMHAHNAYTDLRLKIPKPAQENILERIEQGETQEAIAADFKVTQPRINQIANKLRKEREAREQAKREAEAAQTRAIITIADWRDWLPLQPDCDLLLTDPPYSTDVVDVQAFASDWLPVALQKVKRTGRAFVFIGAYPEEIHAYLSVVMPTQVLVWTYRNTLGPSPSDDYKLNWQAILYYRMPDAGPLNCQSMLEQFSVQDVSAPDGRLGDRYHTWQKPDELAERFIRHATKSGDLVLDPFACTGTFLLAAGRLGRYGRGCEIDKTHAAIATQRGCAEETNNDATSKALG